MIMRVCVSIAIALAVVSQATADSLKVDFNGNVYGDVVEQTQAGFGAYNARNEVAADFVSAQYSAFGTTVTVTPRWVSRAVAAARQAWNRGNDAGYSTDPADMLDLVIDWIGTDPREVGNPLTLTIDGLPEGVYSWVSYHHDTQNQTGHFNVTVRDAVGSTLWADCQISSSQSSSDLFLADVTTFEAEIVSDGIHPVVLVFEATDTPNFDTMFVMNGFEIDDNQAEWRSDAPLRRPVSPEQPMWLVHIDTWNWPDPQKIIDLIPEDVRPYVVFNISLSISHTDTGWNIVEYGYETAKSWLRTCAENRVWAVIQPSSGGYCHFSDSDLSVFEEFYRDYPNFIGFNYCEQFWGFNDYPWSVTWTERVAHWARLMELNDRYGGYLIVSWCGGYWATTLNPIAMMKSAPDFAAICRQSPDNFILCEKFTFGSNFFDIESLCLGAYLSGFSGQYGIRFDHGGWSDANGNGDDYPTGAGAIPHLEHVMLTGQTVIDGPELIWVQCFHGGGTVQTADGYSRRQWETFPQFDNISVDIFRKIVDGTIRIPSRKEVIDRTKVVIVNNVRSGSNQDRYSAPITLFEGLYRMDDDGNFDDNRSWFKRTGRYPSIPTVFQLSDSDAQSFQVQVDKTGYSSRWPTISSKVAEFNDLFPEEYTGELYVGRHENGWVTYNPYKTGQTASASIPFKYNTCGRMELSYSPYSAGVIKEFSDHLTFYLTNYDVDDSSLKTDTIRIYGAASEPTFTFVDRASHQASTVTAKVSRAGTFVLTVTHNGPLDITVNCAGSATGRLTSYQGAAVVAPAQPAVYTGPRQYEAEHFDYRNISGNVTNGVDRGIGNYTGQGYMKFGTNSAARARDVVTVLEDGDYWLETRYAVTGEDVDTIDLYVNGSKAARPTFKRTATLSDWAINLQRVTLNAGENTIEFRADDRAPHSIYFDHIVIVPTTYSEGVAIQENEAGFRGVDGMIGDDHSGYTGDGYADTDDSVGAGIDWEVSFDASATKSFAFRYACPDNRTADLIVNGPIVTSDIPFASTGGWSAWEVVTVYASTDAGVSSVRLSSTSAAGLPNVDYLALTGGTAFEEN